MNFFITVLLSAFALYQIQAHSLNEIQPRLIGAPLTDADRDRQNDVAFFSSDFPNNAVCSGAVIHYKWIVTAASCIKKYSLVDLRIRRGKVLPRLANGQTHFSEGDLLNRIIIHPQYSDVNRFNDIALVNPLNDMIDKQIRPYLITKTDQKAPNLDVLLRGYGINSADDDNSETDELHQTKAVLFNIAECRKYDPSVQSTNLCTLRGRACAGDQGGALVSQSSGELIGIISVSAQVEALCGLDSKPITTYTNLFSFRKWISDTTTGSI